MTFGYYDKTKFSGDIDWHPVDYKYMYGVPFDDILVNGKSVGVCKDRSEKCLMTFDSGTSLMSIPKFAAKRFVENGLPVASLAKKCSSEKDFGEMTLLIGGKKY